MGDRSPRPLYYIMRKREREREREKTCEWLVWFENSTLIRYKLHTRIRL